MLWRYGILLYGGFVVCRRTTLSSGLKGNCRSGPRLKGNCCSAPKLKGNWLSALLATSNIAAFLFYLRILEIDLGTLRVIDYPLI